MWLTAMIVSPPINELFSFISLHKAASFVVQQFSLAVVRIADESLTVKQVSESQL
jgi:hypothetical protein